MLPLPVVVSLLVDPESLEVPPPFGVMVAPVLLFPSSMVGRDGTVSVVVPR